MGTLRGWNRRHMLLLLSMVASTAPGCLAHQAQGAQISPSVLLIGKFDWEVSPGSDGRPWSRCLDMVRAAAATSGSDILNFVPTHHWLGPAGKADSGVASFCYMQGRDGKNKCYDWSNDVINKFKESMTLCFGEALRLGLTICVRPHLDDGTANGAWRNGLIFKPAEKYGGYSYYDVMLAPVADALRSALMGAPGTPTRRVYFAMQGEMSATVMRLPRDWAALVSGLRVRAGGGALADVRMGIGVNFNRLDDTTSASKTYSSSRLSWLAWLLDLEGGDGPNTPPLDQEGVKELVADKLDFVGISAYAPLSGPGFASKELENAAFMFSDEMRPLGVDLPALLNSGKLELHYSEYGLGGGGSYGGGQVVSNPSLVALRPFFGIYGPYHASSDPWSVPANRAFLREFYSKSAAWLSDPNNKTHRISSVFVWDLASWDVLGIYPESTTSEGSYKDSVVVGMVQQHNAAVRATRTSGGVPTAGSNGAVSDAQAG